MIKPQYPLSKMFWRKAKAEYQNRVFFNEQYLELGYAFFEKTKVKLSLPQELAWLAHMTKKDEKFPFKTDKSGLFLAESFKGAKLDIGEKTALKDACKMVLDMAKESEDASLWPLQDAFLYPLSSEENLFSQHAACMREDFPNVSTDKWVEFQKNWYKQLLSKESVFRTPMARNYWENRIRENLTHAVIQHPAQQESLFGFKH